MSEKLKPCPYHEETKPIHVYCGEFESSICEDEEDYQDGNPGSAQCDCGAFGPTDYSFDGCIAAWNNRPVEGALIEALHMMLFAFHTPDEQHTTGELQAKSFARAALQKAYRA